MSCRLKSAGIVGFMLSFLLAQASCNGDSSSGKSIGTSAGEGCKQFTFSVADLKDSSSGKSIGTSAGEGCKQFTFSVADLKDPNKTKEIENFFREQLGNLDATEHVTVTTTIQHQSTFSTPFPTVEISTQAPEGTIIPTYVSTSMAKEIPSTTAVAEITSETTAVATTKREIKTTTRQQYASTTPASTTSELETTTEAYHSTGTRSAEEIRLVKKGWNRASNGYFYKFFATAETWLGAKTNCSEKGAILASALMREAAIRQAIFADMVGYGLIWIGLSDIDQEGKWMWEDGVESTGDDVEWNDGEPNNSGGNEDCGLYNFRDLQNSFANDAPCSKKFNYFCEKSPGP